MQRLVISGVNGLLGSNLAAYFAKSYQVVGLHRANADLSNIKHLNIELAIVDVLDVLELDQVIKEGDIVIHTAAIVSFSDSSKKNMHAVNVGGTANIVNVCLKKQVKQFIQFSSVAALGRPVQAGQVTDAKKWEDSPYNTEYAKTKFLAECEVWRGIAEGLPATILRPSVILGEANWNKSSSKLFKYVFDQKKFYSSGKISIVDVLDLVKATDLIMNSNETGEAYILSGDHLSYKSFFEAIAAEFKVPAPSIKAKIWQAELLWRFEKLKSWIFGSEPLITKETARTANIDIAYDASKYLERFKTPFTPFGTTIERICRYYRLKIESL